MFSVWFFMQCDKNVCERNTFFGCLFCCLCFDLDVCICTCTFLCKYVCHSDERHCAAVDCLCIVMWAFVEVWCFNLKLILCRGTVL